VCGAVLCLWPAGAWVPPHFVGMSLVAGCGWVGHRFGLKCISFLHGVEVFLASEFVCSLSGVSFFWLAHLWRILVGGVEACGFSVILPTV